MVFYIYANEQNFVVGYGSTADSRELAVLVGQNEAKCGIWNSWVLRFDYEWGYQN